MTREVAEAVALVTEAIERHVAHGYGEITIHIKPGSIRVQEGRGHIIDVPVTRGKNGKE